jgi:AcrR family transcriptional regulator
MVRSHGWSGNAPASDEEAIDRILNTADGIIAERGSAMRIADVARELGVTRQTVYRYFPGTEALLVATAMRSADGFLDRLARHVRGLTDPVAATLEGMVFAIQDLAADAQIGIMLSRREQGGVSASISSDTALTFGRAMLHRFDVDWAANGFDEAALEELAEFSIRVLHSFLIDRGQTPRDTNGLRQFLARWLGPAIVYPRVAAAMESVGTAAAAASRAPKRRTAS